MRIIDVATLTLCGLFLATGSSGAQEAHERRAHKVAHAGQRDPMRSGLRKQRPGSWRLSGVAALEPEPGIASLEEEIVVYGRKLKSPLEFTEKYNPVTLGPVTVSGVADTRLSHSGLVIQFATPIFNLQATDFVIGVGAGHDQRTEASTAREAAITAGIRLTF